MWIGYENQRYHPQHMSQVTSFALTGVSGGPKCDVVRCQKSDGSLSEEMVIQERKDWESGSTANVSMQVLRMR